MTLLNFFQETILFQLQSFRGPKDSDCHLLKQCISCGSIKLNFCGESQVMNISVVWVVANCFIAGC